jgi:integral membrane protein (TIGR00529 family)
MLDLLKLILILGLTVFLLVRKWDLGLVLLLDTVLVAVLYLYPPLAFLVSIWRGAIAPATLELAGAVFLVLLLAELLHRTRSMERMVSALQRVIPDSRIVLAMIPAMIGLMPMLGGAMFSAPMVNGVGSRLKISAERKTFVNYWFRHTMEYVFPLYSSLLMIAALLGITPYAFVRVSYPLSLAAIAGGIVGGLLGIPRGQVDEHDRTARSLWKDGWRELLLSTWPLLLVILLVIALGLPMLPSLGAAIVLFMLVDRIGPGQWLDIVKRSFPLRTFSAIWGVMIFKQVVEDVGAVQSIPDALSGLGLSPLLVAFLVTHLSGLLTGTAAAAMALTVPLVAPLMDTLGIDHVVGGVWMFVGAFSGVMLSPLHLCLALTRAYFGANWGRLYLTIVPATALVVAVAVAIVFWGGKA